MKKAPELETKTFPFEIKELTDEGSFEGYAAVFNKPDGYNEVIEEHAFDKTLKSGTTYPLLWYHDVRQPLGVAEVEIDKKGLKVVGQLNLEVQAAREKYALMKQKAIQGLSFGFQTVKDAWNGSLRILKEVKLYEISPATFQAHPKALITAVKDKEPGSSQKPIEGAVEFIVAIKGGPDITDAHKKLLDHAHKALTALLADPEPSADTPGEGKGIFSSTVEALGSESKDADKPHAHLFGPTIQALGNPIKE